MTYEMQKSLERELNDAKTPEDIAKAQSHILIALMDCQRKTAERVKKLTWKLLAALGGGGGIIGFVADKVSWASLLGIGQ